MRTMAMLAAMLLATAALAQEPAKPAPTVIDDVFPPLGPPCGEEAPATALEHESRADYAMDEALIDAVEKGDRSAIALLQRRYPSMLSWYERARVSGALLGHTANDAAIWKEIEAHAENYIRFSAEDDASQAKLEAYCAERGYDSSDDYMAAEFSWFVTATMHPRSRALLLRALQSDATDVVQGAIAGFATLREESALPLIRKAIERLGDGSMLAGALIGYQSDAADELAMQFLDEADRGLYQRERRSIAAEPPRGQ